MKTETNQHATPSELGTNKVVVDPDKLSSASDTLFRWLGSFWSEIYEDDGLIKNLQNGRAIRLCQLYLDVLEALKLQDRENAPVFHRERWFPIIVKKSDRNTGSAGLLKIGTKNEAVIGKQTSELYPENTVFTLGGKKAKFKDLVVYPLDRSVKRIVSCIVDNIASPNVILHAGTDFSVMDGCLVLGASHDPFNDDSGFCVFEDPYIDTDNPDDAFESVMWACDTMIDKDYVYGHLGYAMSLATESSEGYKRIVNAVWNMVSDGASPGVLKALIASICGVPTVVHPEEMVETIMPTEEGGYKIVTDKEVYTLPQYSVLRKGVRAGVKLRRFDTLEDSVRIYPYIVDVDRIEGYTEFDDKLESDIPVVDLPPAYIRAAVDDGFSIGWDERDIVCHGFDRNGNPKLGFRLDGSEEDNDMFWNDVWDAFEEAGASIEYCFRGYIYDTVYDVGKTCGKIIPIRFFLRHFIGANTLIVTVRTDALPDDAPLYDPKFFDTVRSCIPENIRLYFIEHETADSESYDVSNEGGVEEDTDLYAYDESFDEARFGSKHGFRCKDKLTSMKFVAKCIDKDDYDDYD